MLKPDAFGAMTAVLDVPMRRRQKLSGPKGLTGDCRHRYRPDGKVGRNTFEGREKRGVRQQPSRRWRDAREHPVTIDRD